MALKELEKLAREAASKFGLVYVRILHSLGDVKIAEASVLVQVFFSCSFFWYSSTTLDDVNIAEASVRVQACVCVSLSRSLSLSLSLSL
jgi:hypothetical protein